MHFLPRLNSKILGGDRDEHLQNYLFFYNADELGKNLRFLLFCDLPACNKKG